MIALLLAAVAAAAGAYAWRERAATSVPQEKVVIAISSSYVGSCPVVAAQQRGFFAQAGVQAQLQPHPSGKSALSAALKGQAQLATAADIPIMFAIMEQEPVSVIATIFKSDRDHGLLARPGSGITGPGHLKGKRIGVSFGTSAHFVLNTMLNRQLLAVSDVTLHNMPADQFASALERGEVDVVSTWEPYLGTVQRQLSGKGALFYAEDLYEIPYNLVGSKEYVVSHPETLKRVLRAVIQGAAWCRDEPAAAQEMIAAMMKPQGEKWRALWPTYRFGVSLDQGLLLALEDETRWALANRLASGPMPNYLNAVDFKPLQAVAPGAVTIIH
ncbi:nitrate ABC transporter substrate-binding protein [Duganella ginsengisoli]|uniref:Nitrate ABC transporter substrate-binding protein n=2 Tax=Pseudoduganella ginsengisoli TaxID=1462440 RepID=A0A6L6PYK3_9BURK|nr:NrtA/SsuA/CpmA family ABC transporter substrate-binding protein [Pseudoduganella ginsengisoli]MTW01772.1 nitrate ABC transporter substrate-binding protein [Pseudoduganella ginsengisoli]